MVRSMYSAVSGLKNHQTRMDVIANNIANVNTVGFKASRVTFQDIYSQTIRTASEGNDTRGGTNPHQIGLGVTVGSIDTAFTQSGTQSTGLNLDLAIEGDGFFVVADSDGNNYFTRAGNFEIDNSNYIVNSDGLYLMDIDGEDIDTTGYTDITINSNGEVIGMQGSTPSVIATIGLAVFSNPNGLSKTGNSLYTETQNSGAFANAELPGENGAGYLRPGELELSNVDLASEFTDMITTQRGFQANSRTITTSDTMLEELINLKR